MGYVTPSVWAEILWFLCLCAINVHVHMIFHVATCIYMNVHVSH